MTGERKGEGEREGAREHSYRLIDRSLQVLLIFNKIDNERRNNVCSFKSFGQKNKLKPFVSFRTLKVYF